MDRKLLIATAAILAVFSLGLVAFFLVSDGIPDGLDKTMEETGYAESEPVYTAPLDYGSDYLSSLLLGIVGFFITMTVMFGIIKLRKSVGSQ